LEKIMKKLLVLACLFAFIATPAWAFHDAGVADCAGCHTMHNSEDGVLIDADSPLGNSWLLKDATPSDVCLNCHATGLGAVLGADALVPPPEKGSGNFVFLLEDNLNDGYGGATNPISGDAAGHNVNAPGHGLGADGVVSTSPGGTFPASQLGCSSCHDPHGNENFRMLYGAGGDVQHGLTTFLNPAPVASGLSIFFGSEANDNHTAYESGMSEWCGNCHGDFHDEAGGRLEHPSGSTIGAGIATTYDLYNGTDDQLGGTNATAYLAMVPFEDAAATVSSTTGPTAGSNVMCLTCHRAHASSAPNAGRWDFAVTLMDEDGANSGAFAILNPYGPNQRSMCNKCHNKDEGDHLPF
jgi:predicted CXXCH cytochrome family protein